MRKIFFALFLMSILLFANSGKPAVREALGQLEEASRAFLATLATLLCLPGLVLVAIAAAAYYMKMKGKEDPGAWKWVVYACALFGGLALVGAIVAMLLYMLAPSMIGGLVAP